MFFIESDFLDKIFNKKKPTTKETPKLPPHGFLSKEEAEKYTKPLSTETLEHGRKEFKKFAEQFKKVYSKVLKTVDANDRRNYSIDSDYKEFYACTGERIYFGIHANGVSYKSSGGDTMEFIDNLENEMNDWRDNHLTKTSKYSIGVEVRDMSPLNANLCCASIVFNLTLK